MSIDIEKAPGYLVVQETIRQRILEGKLVFGQKLCAEREMGKEFGLSRLTINKGLNGLVAEGFLERRHGQGTFVAYLPPDKATIAPDIDTVAPPPRLVKFISSLLTVGQTPMRNTFLDGMYSVLSERNFDCGIDFYHDVAEQVGYLRNADPRCHAGFLIFFYPYRNALEELNRLRASGFPFVLIDAFPKDYDMDFVVSDNIAGASIAVEHLTGLGHHNIVYITRPIDRSSISDRLTGFFKGMSFCNAPVTSDSVHKLAHAGPAALSEIRPMIDAVLARPVRPTALFFSNDDLAMEAMDYLSAIGIRIPEEMSIMGYYNIELSYATRVPLSTVEQDFFAMGAESAKILLERIDGIGTSRPVQLYLKPTLIARASTGPVPCLVER